MKQSMSLDEPAEMPTDGGTELATSSSGTATPRSSELSDSAFNYDVEKNWSVIFTDDNNSTDHDLNSNYSSSADDDGDRNNTQDIVSDTESTNASNPYASIRGNKRTETSSTLRPAIGSFDDQNGGLQSNSVSTIRGDQHPEDSYRLPDPIGSANHTNETSFPLMSKVNNENDTPPQVVENYRETVSSGSPTRKGNMYPLESLSWTTVKPILVYLVIGILVIDKGMQLFNMNPLGSFKVSPHSHLINEPHSWTIVSYTPDKDDYKTKVSTLSIANGNPDSWDLVKALYSNIASSVETNMKELAADGLEVFEQGRILSGHLMGRIFDHVHHVDWDGHLESFSVCAHSLMSHLKDEKGVFQDSLTQGTEGAAKLYDMISAKSISVFKSVKEKYDNANSSRANVTGIYHSSLSFLNANYGKLSGFGKGETLILKGNDLKQSIGRFYELGMRNVIHSDISRTFERYKNDAGVAANSLWSKITG